MTKSGRKYLSFFFFKYSYHKDLETAFRRNYNNYNPIDCRRQEVVIRQVGINNQVDVFWFGQFLPLRLNLRWLLDLPSVSATFHPFH